MNELLFHFLLALVMSVTFCAVLMAIRREEERVEDEVMLETLKADKGYNMKKLSDREARSITRLFRAKRISVDYFQRPHRGWCPVVVVEKGVRS